MGAVVLSVVGSDRPGLTQALSAAVLQAGGNWLQSHLSRLGGLYVGSVLVELPADRVEALRSAVGGLDGGGLDVRVAPGAVEAGAEGDIVRFSLLGGDRPGIVHLVTRALSALGVNIEDFDSDLVTEPHSGAPLFRAEARLRLPEGVDAERVRTALEDISAEIMVDISLSPVGPA